MRFIKILFLCCVFVTGISSARTDNSLNSNSIFKPIAKYIQQADVEKLSTWFDNNLELIMLSKVNNCSKEQSKQILKSFFNSYKPRNFNITHTAGQDNIKYALGSLDTGSKKFNIMIVMTLKEDQGHKIKIIKIAKKIV